MPVWEISFMASSRRASGIIPRFLRYIPYDSLSLGVAGIILILMLSAVALATRPPLEPAKTSPTRTVVRSKSTSIISVKLPSGSFSTQESSVQTVTTFLKE